MEDQTAQFTLDVTLPLEKALTEDAAGDLHIEGIASDFSVDRQNEAVLPGAFDEAISRFIAAGGPLCYHHKPDQQLGQVTALTATADGLLMKATIPKPADSSPLLDVYNKIKRGMMRGLSVGGRGIRRMTAAGPRVVSVDLQEISITPVPVGPKTLFGVVAKAFGTEEEYVGPYDRAELADYFNRQFASAEALLDHLKDLQ